jgi:hypothetical protein
MPSAFGEATPPRVRFERVALADTSRLGSIPTVEIVSELTRGELLGTLVLLGCGSVGNSAEVFAVDRSSIDLSLTPPPRRTHCT